MSELEHDELIWADPSQPVDMRQSTSTLPATRSTTLQTLKRTRIAPQTPKYQSELCSQVEAIEEDDVEDLLGLRESESAYDPWTICQVNEIKKAMKSSESQVLRAILAMQDKRFKAIWHKMESLSANLESAKRSEGMVNFLYAWVKSAEANGVHKLPARF